MLTRQPSIKSPSACQKRIFYLLNKGKPLFQLGKAGQAGASALFNVLAIAMYVFEAKDNSEGEMATFGKTAVIFMGVIAVLANIGVTAMTRLAAMDKKIRKLAEPAEEKSTPVPEGISKCRLNLASCISYFAKFCNIFGLLWVCINTIFFVLKVGDFSKSAAGYEEISDEGKAILYFMAAYICVSNLISSLALNFAVTLQNIGTTIKDLFYQEWNVTYEAGLTLLLQIINAYLTYTFAYYSTLKSLTKLGLGCCHGVADLLARLSTISAVVNGFFSSITQAHVKLSSLDSKVEPYAPSLWFVICNIIDTLFIVGANMVGYIDYSARNSGTDLYDASVFIQALFFSAIVGWFNYIYSDYAASMTIEDREEQEEQKRQVIVDAPVDVAIAEQKVSDEKVTLLNGSNGYNPRMRFSGARNSLSAPNDYAADSLALPLPPAAANRRSLRVSIAADPR